MTLYATVWETYGRGDAANFVRRLKLLMRQHRVSQADLARVSGFHPTHVSRWLSGRVAPSLESKLMLDEALDIIVSDLAADAGG